MNRLANPQLPTRLSRLVSSGTQFLSITLALLSLSVFTHAAVLTGQVKSQEGEKMSGVLIRVTDEANGVSESVYTDPEGVYKLVTRLEGTLKVRARTPYFKDAHTTVELGGSATTSENIVMQPMTDAQEISDSLPAAYHFYALPFEEGDDKDFNAYQFQRDCLSCHQMGNPFTRIPRTAESWAVTIQRMHRMVGNFDEKLRDRRSEILAAGFDGKPIKARPEFPIHAELQSAKIYEYMLDRAFVPHDSIVHPTNGLIYTVDQALDHMVVTDPISGQSQYVVQSDGDANKYHKDVPKKQVIGEFDPGTRHGPHSLDLGKDGKYYVTNTGTHSIGVFDPQTNTWEPSHMIPREEKAYYPHTIRVDSKGYAWFTLAASEKVGRLLPDNGSFDIVSLPEVEPDGISGGTQPYGIDISPVDDRMWYGRLFADKIGTVDAETLEVTEYDSPIRGPRRMRFDKEGILWVSGYSEGQLARIDVSDGFEATVYDMPEFAEGARPAPYALGVHPIHQDIWLNENMTDRIYRFIPKEERWVVYPVPLSGTYTRDMTFMADGQVCLSNNPIPPPALEGGTLEIICLDPDYNPETEDQQLAVSQR
ncbi:MAG: carboxypeptidase regulatory-like domain-containing protein [Pseudomonadales bacterium]